MNDSILEMLEESADELLSKARKSDELDPDEITEDAETEEEEDADGGEAEDFDESDDEPEDDESGDESDDDESEDEEDSADMNKSVITTAMEDDETSEMLTALVEVFAKSLADVQDTNESMHNFNKTSSDALAKSLLAQNVILGEQAKSLSETRAQLADIKESIGVLAAKMEDISAQPAHMRKSVQSYTVTDRNFQGSLEGSETQPQPLSKAEVLSILNNELVSGSNIVTADDIVSAESGAPLRSDIRALLASKRAR